MRHQQAGQEGHVDCVGAIHKVLEVCERHCRADQSQAEGNRLSKTLLTNRAYWIAVEGVEVEVCDHGHFDKGVHRPREYVYPVVGHMLSDDRSWPNHLEHRCQQNRQLGLVAKPPSDRGTFVDQAHESLRIGVGRQVVPATDVNGNKDVSGRQWRLFFFASPV
jgi:hypothetical protein